MNDQTKAPAARNGAWLGKQGQGNSTQAQRARLLARLALGPITTLDVTDRHYGAKPGSA
jgi:hypothetical protein